MEGHGGGHPKSIERDRISELFGKVYESKIRSRKERTGKWFHKRKGN